MSRLRRPPRAPPASLPSEQVSLLMRAPDSSPASLELKPHYPVRAHGRDGRGRKPVGALWQASARQLTSLARARPAQAFRLCSPDATQRAPLRQGRFNGNFPLGSMNSGVYFAFNCTFDLQFVRPPCRACLCPCACVCVCVLARRRESTHIHDNKQSVPLCNWHYRLVQLELPVPSHGG